jgi:hypothetical protein
MTIGIIQMFRDFFDSEMPGDVLPTASSGEAGGHPLIP